MNHKSSLLRTPKHEIIQIMKNILPRVFIAKRKDPHKTNAYILKSVLGARERVDNDPVQDLQTFLAIIKRFKLKARCHLARPLLALS